MKLILEGGGGWGGAGSWVVGWGEKRKEGGKEGEMLVGGVRREQPRALSVVVSFS